MRGLRGWEIKKDRFCELSFRVWFIVFRSVLFLFVGIDVVSVEWVFRELVLFCIFLSFSVFRKDR